MTAADKLHYQPLIPALSDITSSYEQQLGNVVADNKTTINLVTALMETLDQMSSQATSIAANTSRSSMTMGELENELQAKKQALTELRATLASYLDTLGVFSELKGTG